MKIQSDNFLTLIKNKSYVYKFILLYGPNIGLVNLFFNNLINTLNIDITDPFNVSKLTAQNIIDTPNLLIDTLSTFSLISNKRIILLDLCNIPIKKSLMDSIINAISSHTQDFLVIIKADNLGAQNELVQYTQFSKIGILVACYEDSINKIKLELSNILRENKIQFSDSFLLNLASKFSNDSSINNMEFDKLKDFLFFY